MSGLLKCKRLCAFGVGLTLSMCADIASNPTAAQNFPSQVIRIVVPSAPSTPPDIISRVIATELTEAEGWKVIVENRPGAVQTVAGADVLKAPADGHTVWAISLPVAAAPALLRNMAFNLTKDFAPLIHLSASYNVLVVNPNVPAKSISELVQLLKSQPDKLNYSSGGFGTPAHLVGEMFKQQTGVKAAHVPYQQFPQAIADLLNGTNHYMFITTLPVVDLVASGKLRALAVTGTKRIDAMKDVPTVVEQGFNTLVVEDWVGFALKQGTPEPVANRLNEAINNALKKDRVREALKRVGADPVGGSATDFGRVLTSQIEHWGKVVRDANLKLPN